MKANSKEKIEVKYSFLKPLSQNFEVLTLCGDVINPKMYQKVQGCISFTNDDTKMGIKRKRYFEVNHSFMRPSSQNFEVLIQRGDVVKLHSLVKGPKLVSHVLMVIQR